jgi:uncharacterized membrane protein
MASQGVSVSDSKNSPISIAPDRVEKLLGWAALLLLVAVAAALVRGYGEWSKIPIIVWFHLGTIILALALTPVMLWRRRGDPMHRQLGWIWALSMFLTAAISLNIRLIGNGNFSFIHILSIFTMVQVPFIVWSARTHNVKRHRSGVRAMVIGALLIAGFFTFPFGRLMGNWLFG